MCATSKIGEKLKNNGHLAFGHQSLEVPLHVTKTLQTQTKRNHNVWKNTRNRTPELLIPFSSWTHVEPQTEDESTKRGSHYDRCSIPWLADSLLLLLWSHGAFDLLVFWLQRKRRVEVSVWSSCLCRQLWVSVCGLVYVLYMVWQKSWFSIIFLDIVDVINRTYNKMVILFPLFLLHHLLVASLAQPGLPLIQPLI